MKSEERVYNIGHMGEKLPTRIETLYEDKSYLVDTATGHAILTYRFPKGKPVPGEYPLHIIGTGFASPATPDGRCYFDPFMNIVANLHDKPCAMAAVTWPGMTWEQVQADKGKKTDYNISAQSSAMPDILDHVNQHIPGHAKSVYFHPFSLGARAMLPAFGEQYGPGGSIIKQWIEGTMGLTPADVSLILHMPAFELNPNIMNNDEYRLVSDAAGLLKRFSWINNSLVAKMVSQAIIEKTLRNLINDKKIHEGNYYNKNLTRKVLHPGTTALHLINLLDSFNAAAHINQARADGFGVHFIRVQNDKLIDDAAVLMCIDEAGNSSQETSHIISEHHTHTAHRHPDARIEIAQAMQQIIEIQEERSKHV